MSCNYESSCGIGGNAHNLLLTLHRYPTTQLCSHGQSLSTAQTYALDHPEAVYIGTRHALKRAARDKNRPRHDLWVTVIGRRLDHQCEQLLVRE